MLLFSSSCHPLISRSYLPRLVNQPPRKWLEIMNSDETRLQKAWSFCFFFFFPRKKKLIVEWERFSSPLNTDTHANTISTLSFSCVQDRLAHASPRQWELRECCRRRRRRLLGTGRRDEESSMFLCLFRCRSRFASRSFVMSLARRTVNRNVTRTLPSLAMLTMGISVRWTRSSWPSSLKHRAEAVFLFFSFRKSVSPVRSLHYLRSIFDLGGSSRCWSSTYYRPSWACCWSEV